MRSVQKKTGLFSRAFDRLHRGQETICEEIDALHERAENAIRHLPPTAAPAPRFARSITRGIHGRRKSGAGDDFWQFRRYQSGDAATDIDWRRSARADQYYIRQNEWETAQQTWIWCDTSPSTRFRSGFARQSKIDRGLTLALGLASLLVDSGEKLGVLGLHERAVEGRYGFRRLMEGLDHQRQTPSGLPELDRIPENAYFILFSDFLFDLDHLRTMIGRMSANGGTGQIVQILDPVEVEFPFEGRIRFEGLEGETREILARAEERRKEYRDRLAALRGELADISARAGWNMVFHRSDKPLSNTLLDTIMGMGMAHDMRHA